MKRALLAALVVLAAFVAYTFLPGGEERAVRDKIRRLAAHLSAPAGEEPLVRGARFAALRSSFTPDVRVELPAEGLSFHTFEELAAFAGRAVPPGGIVLETGDIEVEVRGDHEAADARFPARVLERRGDGEPVLVDARTVSVTLVRHDQAWRISSARIMPSDHASVR